MEITAVSSDYDLNKQSTQIDNFIASGVDMVLLNAADPTAIEPAMVRLKAAGITSVALDVTAKGADAQVQTDNIAAGRNACKYITDKLGGTGNVVIITGPPTSSVLDRVSGCKNRWPRARASRSCPTTRTARSHAKAAWRS